MKNTKIKKAIVISACLTMCFATVGCSMGSKKDSSKNNTTDKSSNIDDIRTAKIFNQQQAILLFTTANKASSVVSIELTEKDGKYTYTLVGVDKKGIEHIYTINAKNGKIVNTVDKGPIEKSKSPQYIDFVPVLDLMKAGSVAVEFASNKDFNEIISYKLYAVKGINVYEFVISNGDTANPKTEKVFINGITGKKLTKKDLSVQNNSTQDAPDQNKQETKNDNKTSDLQ